MQKIKTCFTALSLLAVSCCFAQKTGVVSQVAPPKYFKNKFKKTGVIFTSSDTVLKKLFDAAESKAIKNIHYYSPAYNAAHNISLVIKGKIYKGKVLPNGSYIIRDNKLVTAQKMPFDYPYKNIAEEILFNHFF